MLTEPVIFLDFTGVLEPPAYPAALGRPVEGLNLRLSFELDEPVLADIDNRVVNAVKNQFDPAACAYVQKLVSEYHASIVITSSWRIFHPLSQLRALLKIHHISHVEGVLPPGSVRSELIRAYLRTHQISRYIILDDMDLSKPFGIHYINCQGGLGLSQYEMARSFLRMQS